MPELRITICHTTGEFSGQSTASDFHPEIGAFGTSPIPLQEASRRLCPSVEEFPRGGSHLVAFSDLRFLLDDLAEFVARPDAARPGG